MSVSLEAIPISGPITERHTDVMAGVAKDTENCAATPPEKIFVAREAVEALRKKDPKGKYAALKTLEVSLSREECLQGLVSFQRVGDNDEMLQVKSIKAMACGTMGAIQSGGVMLDDYLIRVNGTNVQDVPNHKVRGICEAKERVEMLFLRDEDTSQKQRVQMEILKDPQLDNSRVRENAAAALLQKQLKDFAAAQPTHAPAAPSSTGAGMPTAAADKAHAQKHPYPPLPKIQHVAYPTGPIVVTTTRTTTDHPASALSTSLSPAVGAAASGGKRVASPPKPTKATPKSKELHNHNHNHDKQTKKRARDDEGGGAGVLQTLPTADAFSRPCAPKDSNEEKISSQQPKSKKARKASGSWLSSPSSPDEEVVPLVAPHRASSNTLNLDILTIGEMVRAFQTESSLVSHPCKILEIRDVADDGKEAYVGWESNNFKANGGEWLPFDKRFFEAYSLPSRRR